MDIFKTAQGLHSLFDLSFGGNMGVVLTMVIAIFFIFSSTLSFARSSSIYYGAKLCQANETVYHCYKVKRGETWEKLFPDANQQDLVMRINRMNTRLHAGMTIAVPQNINSTILEHAPFELQISPPGEKLLLVSISQQAWGAYDNLGTLVRWGPISSAKGYCPDINRACNTPRGNYAIYRKGGSGCVSSKFPVGRGGAPMPYCMFFKGGFALHGSYEVVGYNASHGCVRMYPEDAEWLNEEFTAEDYNVPVVIKS